MPELETSAVAPLPIVRRDVALAMAARAVVAWFGPASRQEAHAKLLLAMSEVDRVLGGLPCRQPHDFLALLARPVRELFSDIDEDQPLIESGHPSACCLDLVAESGSDPHAELVQARVRDARAHFAIRARGEAEYTAFRKFLATHGHATLEEASDALLVSKVALGDLFESPPSDFSVVSRDEQFLVPCPRCTWPMRIAGDVIACEGAECRTRGARFRRTPEGLVPLGKLPIPELVPAAGRVRLRQGAWRYTLLPGLAELDLAAKLEKLPRIKVELWPQRDLYDLLIRRGSCEWRVDVKDWTDAGALARRLVSRPPERGTVIVVPDHRRGQVHVLAERCAGLGLEFFQAREFVALVRGSRPRGRRAK